MLDYFHSAVAGYVFPQGASSIYNTSIDFSSEISKAVEWIQWPIIYTVQVSDLISSVAMAEAFLCHYYKCIRCKCLNTNA